MSTVAAVATARGLYRSLLRTGSRFNDYNFREFARRKTREEFQQARQTDLTAERTDELWKYGVGQLRVLERQVAVDNLFSHHRLPIEY